MKKLLIVLFSFFIITSIYSQTVTATPTATATPSPAIVPVATANPANSLFQAITNYYRVYSDVSDEYTKEIGDKMEACLDLFNNILHFDLTRLQVKLKVIIYKDKAGFDSYLQKLLGQTRKDFVYIHYSDLAKSELVGFKKDDGTFNSLLLHQGLIQFFKAFNPTAPLWLSEGIAAYLEASTYDKDTKKFKFQMNMNWLDTIKVIIKGEGPDTYIKIEDILSFDKPTAVAKINSFYPEAWGLVHFLFNAPKQEYNRLLFDSISVLDANLNLNDNSIKIKNTVFKWIDFAAMETDFQTYIKSLKTFPDYVQDGLTAFNANDLDKSKIGFQEALKLKPTDYFPYYYLGLIEYGKKNYYKAEEYYLSALKLGSDPALTNYALGVNAYADNKFDAASVYLKEARKVNAEKYWEKVQDILNRIDAENKGFTDTKQ